MKLIVQPHKITIDKQDLVNEKEINITECQFEFQDIPDNYVKEAYFTYQDTSYKVILENNRCQIPNEVLQQKGDIEIGCVCYLVDGDDITRYNPSPVYINTLIGSLKDAQNTEPITPTDKEQIEQMLNNINIDGEKVGKITTITITYKDGTSKELTLEDGKSIEYNWQGTELGIRQEGESTYQYVDLKGDKGDAGAIKMEIVAQLPQTGADDTIYLVPYEQAETGNIYKEYIYVNGNWEELGSIPIQVDLTDYVKFTDYATSSTGGVIKANGYYGADVYNGTLLGTIKNYATYGSQPDSTFISKGTLENVITGKDLTTKSYVDGLVGNINDVLDAINGEVI